MPGAPLSQVKLRPGSNAVTFHIAGGNLGCLIRARVPTPIGPPPTSRMLRTDWVHSCQRSTSDMTAQTTSDGAAISTEVRNSTTIEYESASRVTMPINQGAQATLEASRRALSSAELRLLRAKASSLEARARRASRRFPLISAGMVGVLWLATMLASDAPWPVVTGFWAVVWLGLTLWGMKDLRTSTGYMTAMAAGLESALRRKEADVFAIRSRS